MLHSKQVGSTTNSHLIILSLVANRSLITNQCIKACFGMLFTNQTVLHQGTEGPLGCKLSHVKEEENIPGGAEAEVFHKIRSGSFIANCGVEGKQARIRIHSSSLRQFPHVIVDNLSYKRHAPQTCNSRTIWANQINKWT